MNKQALPPTNFAYLYVHNEQLVMQPVVFNPKITFAQLARELSYVADDAHHALARDQLIAKLQRKRARFDAEGRRRC